MEHIQKCEVTFPIYLFFQNAEEDRRGNVMSQLDIVPQDNHFKKDKYRYKSAQN